MSNHSFVREILPQEINLFQDMLQKLRMKKKTQHITQLRCALYARKSTVDKTDTSLDAQITYCRELIAKSPLLKEVFIFKEDNTSGMSANRKEFQEMFELVKRKEIDVIVCMARDRFSRKTADYELYKEIAFKNVVYLLVGDEQIFVNDATTKFAQSIMLATNELYARQSAEKTFNCLRMLASEGNYVAGQTPFGYQKVNKKLDIYLEESVIVSEIFTQVIQGHTFGSIADRLNQQGYRTRGGNLFSKQSVQFIAQNPVYTGKLIYNKKGR